MGKYTSIASSAFLAIGGFLFGYDSGIVSSTITQPEFIAYFHDPNDTTTGGIVSSFQGGAVLGTIISMIAADYLGRKRSIAVGSIVSVLGCALQGGAVDIAMLIVGRFIAGVAVGILTSTIPMYAAELSEPRWRGLQSGLLQWFLSWGFLVAQWLGYGLSYTNTNVQWRFPLAFQVIPPTIIAIGIWFLQESPRWLVEKDRYDEAIVVLRHLRSPRPDLEEFVDLEFREIRDVVVADRIANQTSWKVILTKPSWRKRLILGCYLQAQTQLSGINVINYYGTRIYRILDIPEHTSLMITGISGALSIVYCTVALLTLDKTGRIKPLLVSVLVMAAALLCNAVMGQHLNPDNHNELRAMVAMNFVFSLAYTPLGVISWVYPAEIFPLEARALGNACSTFTNWVFNLVFAQFTPQALSAIAFGYFYVFFALNLVAFGVFWFFFPETKGKTLEQMDELFGDQLVPHALQDPEAAAMAEEDMKLPISGATHVEEKA